MTAKTKTARETPNRGRTSHQTAMPTGRRCSTMAAPKPTLAVKAAPSKKACTASPVIPRPTSAASALPCIHLCRKIGRAMPAAKTASAAQPAPAHASGMTCAKSRPPMPMRTKPSSPADATREPPKMRNTRGAMASAARLAMSVGSMAFFRTENRRAHPLRGRLATQTIAPILHDDRPEKQSGPQSNSRLRQALCAIVS